MQLHISRDLGKQKWHWYCYYLNPQGRPDSDDRPSVPTPSPWGWPILVSFGLKTTHNILGPILTKVCQRTLEFCCQRTNVKSELSETDASCHWHSSNLHLLIYVRYHCLGFQQLRKIMFCIYFSILFTLWSAKACTNWDANSKTRDGEQDFSRLNNEWAAC